MAGPKRTMARLRILVEALLPYVLLVTAFLHVASATPQEDLLCFEVGTTYEPLNMKDKPMGQHAASAADCQKLCQQTRECYHFSFDTAAHLCHLEDMFATQMITHYGFIAGPQTCPEDMTPQQKQMLTRLETRGVGMHTYVELPFRCMEMSSMYVPVLRGPVSFSPMEKPEMDDKNALLACQHLCDTTEGCYHFTMMFPERACSLSGAQAVLHHPVFDHVSGPPSCDHDPTAAPGKAITPPSATVPPLVPPAATVPPLVPPAATVPPSVPASVPAPSPVTVPTGGAGTVPTGGAGTAPTGGAGTAPTGGISILKSSTKRPTPNAVGVAPRNVPAALGGCPDCLAQNCQNLGHKANGDPQEGACTEECMGNKNCSMGMICCSNGCGHTCMIPQAPQAGGSVNPKTTGAAATQPKSSGMPSWAGWTFGIILAVFIGLSICGCIFGKGPKEKKEKKNKKVKKTRGVELEKRSKNVVAPEQTPLMNDDAQERPQSGAAVEPDNALRDSRRPSIEGMPMVTTAVPVTTVVPMSPQMMQGNQVQGHPQMAMFLPGNMMVPQGPMQGMPQGPPQGS